MDTPIKPLIEALRLAALPFDDQQRVLPTFVRLADEIALIYDDAFRLLSSDQAIELGAEATSKLHGLDSLFAEMSAKKDLWDDNALRSAPEWLDVRRIATEALASLHQPVAVPDLSFLEYIKGRN